MIEPKLIQCPNCKKEDKSAFLGSVTSQGYFIVRRGQFKYDGKYKHASNLIIMSESYAVYCECGYKIEITSGQLMQPQVMND